MKCPQNTLIGRFIHETLKALNRESPKKPLIPNILHKIILIKEENLVSKPYRNPIKIYNELNIELNRLLEQGIISKSNSNICSAALVLQKNSKA